MEHKDRVVGVRTLLLPEFLAFPDVDIPVGGRSDQNVFHKDHGVEVDGLLVVVLRVLLCLHLVHIRVEETAGIVPEGEIV